MEEGIENALNLVVLTTDKSGDMKKELKQTIYETVSTTRNLFVKLKNNCDVKSSKICELEAEVSKVKTELQRVKRQSRKGTWGAICYPKSRASRMKGTRGAICYSKAGTSWAEGLGGGSIWWQREEALFRGLG